MLGNIVIFAGMAFIVVGGARYIVAPGRLVPLSLLTGEVMTQTIANSGLLGASKNVKTVGLGFAILGIAAWLLGVYRRRRG